MGSLDMRQGEQRREEGWLRERERERQTAKLVNKKHHFRKPLLSGSDLEKRVSFPILHVKPAG